MNDPDGPRGLQVANKNVGWKKKQERASRFPIISQTPRRERKRRPAAYYALSKIWLFRPCHGLLRLPSSTNSSHTCLSSGSIKDQKQWRAREYPESVHAYSKLLLIHSREARSLSCCFGKKRDLDKRHTLWAHHGALMERDAIYISGYTHAHAKPLLSADTHKKMISCNMPLLLCFGGWYEMFALSHPSLGKHDRGAQLLFSAVLVVI